VFPFSPSTTRITSDAGVEVAARPSTPSVCTHTKLTARYNKITATTPINNALGRFFRGSRISPATKLAVCHPPYANKTGTSAAPKAPIDDSPPATSELVCDVADECPLAANPTPTSAAIAAIFNAISALCTLLPARTPRQLMVVKHPKAIAPTTQSLSPT